MEDDACEVCGYKSQGGDINKYDVIPDEIIKEAGKLQSRKTTLCNNCHEELGRVYSKLVTSMTYDTRLKQFRTKSPQEMVKEYEVAYQWFTQHRKSQQKIA